LLRLGEFVVHPLFILQGLQICLGYASDINADEASTEEKSIDSHSR
jgi:hypothetical protein